MKNIIKETTDKYGYRVVVELNQNNQLIKETHYHPDGKTIWYINEYDPQTGHPTKQTEFKSDGKTIDVIEEYDLQTGNLIKTTYFRLNSKTIDYIREYDPKTGKIIKDIFYNPDGSIRSIEEYDEDDDDHECNCEYCDQ
ncbi:DUF2963 domain-containing protein [Candidatus Phytoplasma solani]|uniref:DUF2963 domain-containing protein n=1 Tax=Candidatus Phytoplasma solani TaxID=69896 RepID=UPI00358E3E6E